MSEAKRCTTDGQPPQNPNLPGAPSPIDPETGQHTQYWVLCSEERAKGFIRPLRDTYIHVGVGGHELDPENPRLHGRKGNGCGVATRMGRALAETYARDNTFYTHTFCCGCRKHLPVEEFVWEDGTVVGS